METSTVSKTSSQESGDEDRLPIFSHQQEDEGDKIFANEKEMRKIQERIENLRAVLKIGGDKDDKLAEASPPVSKTTTGIRCSIDQEEHGKRWSYLSTPLFQEQSCLVAGQSIACGWSRSIQIGSYFQAKPPGTKERPQPVLK